MCVFRRGLIVGGDRLGRNSEMPSVCSNIVGSLGDCLTLGTGVGMSSSVIGMVVTLGSGDNGNETGGKPGGGLSGVAGALVVVEFAS